MTSGCDGRLLLDASGLNPYGCSELPRDVVALGSCTCSSPSRRATRASQQCLEELRSSGDPECLVEQAISENRKRLRDCLQLPSDVEIAFTPSGTDVELLALAIADGSGDREIVNVVVGPTEVGSGTINVAAGLHYDTRLPCGDATEIGDAIDPRLANRVTITTIGIRDSSGKILSEPELDAHVTQVIVDAVSRHARVLLHVVAHSKTGIHAPSWSAIDRITRNMKDDVVVVVDAAQGRLNRSTYRSALDQGFLVSITGSKFFGGPPFSGALLIPASMNPKLRGRNILPAGFDRYFTPAEMPESWQSIRSEMSEWYNIGSLLRWVAAVDEMEHYYDLPVASRRRVIQAFAAAAHETFDSLEHIKLIPSFRIEHADDLTGSLETTPTVFGLRIKDSSGRLNRESLKQLHIQLNRKIGETSDHPNSDALGQSFHLGQPVKIGADMYVLRIALGSPMIVDVATNLELGESFDLRIQWMRDKLLQLRNKLNSLLGSRLDASTSQRTNA